MNTYNYYLDLNSYRAYKISDQSKRSGYFKDREGNEKEINTNIPEERGLATDAVLYGYSIKEEEYNNFPKK